MSRIALRRLVPLAATLGLVATAMPAFAQDALDKIKAKGVVEMGVAAEPPYSDLKADGTLTGADPDVARAVFAELGDIKLNANVVDWGALIPGLMANRFDAVATGLFIRPERCQAVAFSQPVLCTAEGMIVRKGNPKGITSYEALAKSDAIIAVVAGAEQKRALDLGTPPERIMEVPDVFVAVDLLKSGRVDVLGFPDVTLIEVMKNLPADQYELLSPLEGEPIQCSAAAFNPQNKAMRDFYDAGLEKLKASGKFKEILTAYGFNPALPDKITRTELCGAEN